MKKNILVALLGLGGLLPAQKGNDLLKKELEKRNKAKQEQFEFYAQKLIYQNNSKENPLKENVLRENIYKNKENLDFFLNGEPYYIKAFDVEQIKNSNAEVLQEGTLAGLNGKNYNGNGIKVAVFDGGRVWIDHQDFGDASRITNKEASTVPYSSHATNVTGVLGSKGADIRGTINGVPVSGNTKGLMSEATFDSYSFSNTTLPGDTAPKGFLQKLLLSQSSLSNHSYGGVVGWNYDVAQVNGVDAEGWYWRGLYDPATKNIADLNGSYYENDKGYDDIVYYNPSMIVVKSAGNSYGDGPEGNTERKFYGGNAQWVEFTSTDTVPPNNCSQGFDCIPTGGVAKNIIIVGSTNKLSTADGKYSKASDVEKSVFSSAGPRDDGGIKPDIAGVGHQIFMPNSIDNAGRSRYTRSSGTSFSAPHVTGVIGLWSELYQDFFNGQNLNAASAKNLLIHSAQEAGNIGPDVWYGWGFADAQKGAELIIKKNENKIIFEDKNLANKGKNETILYTNGKEPLKVSIVWTDPSYKKFEDTYSSLSNNRTSVLINDLDLRVINVKTKEIYYPWKLSATAPMNPATKGDNVVDNVEQVLIDTPAEGLYRVEVSHKGDLVDNEGKIATQTYSVIATGYEKTLNSVEDATLIAPTLLRGEDRVVNVNFVEKILNISVYDMAGRLIRSISPNTDSYDVDLSGIPAGVYVIHAHSTNYKLSKKIRKE